VPRSQTEKLRDTRYSRHAVIIRNNLIYNNVQVGIYLNSDPSFPVDSILGCNNTIYGHARGWDFAGL